MSLRDLISGIVPFPDQLFWLGRAFRLERRFETDSGAPVCKLEFTPQQPPLTELKLSGESLPTPCSVPPMATRRCWMIRRHAEGPARRLHGQRRLAEEGDRRTRFRLGDQPLVVNATAATNLVLGGPLTNSVTLTRYGRKLLMNYQLKGRTVRSTYGGAADGGVPYLPGAAGPRRSRPSSRSITAARKFCRASSRLAEAAPARTHGEYPSRWRAN